jgi:tol-pal system protein YbgF
MMMVKANQTISRMASLVLAIFISAPVVAQQDNQAMVDLVIKVQQLQDEVRTLTGRLEDQNSELNRLSDRQRDQYLDLDQRINELRGGPAPMVSGSAARNTAPPVTTGSTSSVPQVTQQQDLPDVRDAMNTPSAVTSLPTPDTQARDVVGSPEAEKAAYDQAFQALKELKYADAAGYFTTFLKDYPGSDYADNAQYWLGESYYVTRNYDIALESFKTLLSKYPDSPKVPDSLLKIGYTHYELKQWDQARAALEQVEAQYPGTTLARLAGSRLRSMKLEGNY